MKPKNTFKRLFSGIISLSITASAVPYFPAFADKQTEPYPYTMFAASSDEGAITFNVNNSCINGNIAANGTIITTAQNFNVNGQRIENANENMIFIMDKIYDTYFLGSEVESIDGDYSIEDVNINIFSPVDASGNIEFNGNINLNAGITAAEDINITGIVKNTNNSVICSQTGDIKINSSNVSFSGLIYAPYGDILIDSDNLNLNNVVIIGQTITIECPSFNANYNSYIGEFIGNCCNEPYNPDIPDKPAIDSKPYIFANGKYNPDTSAIDIEWFTENEINNFEIWESYDSDEYVLVDNVMDNDSYQYILTEDFEKKYFKVSFIENENSVVESIPFSVVKTEDGYETVLIDTDEDGLADIYEIIFGTDPQSADTDGDTLSDYQEVYITGTDPTVYDSVTEGVSDADADSDGDGITNADEIDYGTNPQLTDTDGDELSDYDEIYVYGTDPLKDDSDGDGLKDGTEIKLGLDPNNPQTLGVPDGEYQIAQPISHDNDILSSVNTEDSPYIMSIDITSNNDIEENIFVSESEYSGIIKNDAMIGKSIDIDISEECSPSSIIVNFAVSDEYINNTLGTYDKIERFKGIRRLAVFKYFDEINALLPLCTEYDTSANTVSAVIEDDGTYCIIDTEIWLDELGITADDLIGEEITSLMSIKSPSVNILSAEEASSTEKIGKGASGNFFENKPVDLIFAIQNSGFGEEAKQKFEFEKELIRDISNYAFKDYKDVRVHLVAYNIQWDIQNASIDGMPFFSDINQVEEALDKIEYIPNLGVSNRALGHYLAFINAGRLSYRQNAERFIYNFTNYSTYFQDAFGNYLYDFQSVYDYFWRNDMHYSQVIEGGNNFDSFLNNLINGDYSDPRCDSSILPNLIGHDGVDLALDITTKNNYNDIIKSLNQHIEKTSLHGAYSPIDWKKKILGAELAEDKPFDTDGDSVPDWEEIDKSKLIMYEDGSFDLPTINDFINLIANENERKSVLNFLYGNMPALSSETHAYSASSKRSSSMADVVLDLKILPAVSDPTAADSDKDGYTDVDDPEPYNPPKYLEGKYDFLDGDVYYIEALDTSNGEYIDISDTAIMNKFSGNNSQKFRFKWCGNGYKIHCFDDDSLVLTVNMNKNGIGKVSPQKNINSNNQIWEIVPYVNKNMNIISNSFGIIIRSKELYYSDNENKYKPLYLSYINGAVEVTTERNLGTRFNLENVADWLRFGSIYMEGLGWTGYITDNHVTALKNYNYNNNIGIKTTTASSCIDKVNNYYINPKDPTNELVNIKSRYNKDVDWTTAPENENYSNIYNELGNESCAVIGNYKLLQNQYGGNFPKMRYAELKDSKKHQMDYSCCEIMATYNMLAVLGVYDIIDENGKVTNDLTQYSKLTAEFEYNNLMLGRVIGTGIWGSRPSGIQKCLKSYNVNFNSYLDIDTQLSASMENDIKDLKNYTGFGIVSSISPISNKIFEKSEYLKKISEDSILQYIGGIHTYFVFYDQNKNEVVGINRSSSHLKGWRENTLAQVIGNDNLFFLGYLSKK